MKNIIIKSFAIVLILIFTLNIIISSILAFEDDSQSKENEMILESNNIESEKDKENSSKQEIDEKDVNDNSKEELIIDNEEKEKKENEESTDIIENNEKYEVIKEEEENKGEIDLIQENEDNNEKNDNENNYNEEEQEIEEIKKEEINKEKIEESKKAIKSNKKELLQTTKINNSVVTQEIENNTDPLIKYRTHIQSIGWQDWKQNGEMAGTEGKSLRLEGINIELENLPNVDINYQVHIQDIGWQSWKKNGEMAGTQGQALRLEGIRLFLQDSNEFSIAYRVHIQNIGWQNWKYDGEMAGTEGKSLRLEAIEIKLISKKNKSKLYIDTPTNNANYIVSNSPEITVKGWKLANISNTYIKAYINGEEIEENRIKYYNRKDVTSSTILYGTPTQNPKSGFDVNVDISDKKDGVYNITIDLYASNTKINTISLNINIYKRPQVLYNSHVQSIGWQDWKKNGQTAGTEGKSLRLEAMNINIISAKDTKIIYRTHVQDEGWQSWRQNGELTGTTGFGRRLEAIQIKLENMPEYTVEYRTHVQNIGWTDWSIDGETSGTEGRSLRIEAIQIRIVDHYSRTNKGIDVSEFNGIINWNEVKNSGIEFAMIRLGYRGYRYPRLVLDETALYNINGAKSQGIKVGVYFVTQAINTAEAQEEANWCIDVLNANNLTVDYPIVIDTERSTADEDNPGRADLLDIGTRTAVCKTFCETIKNRGQKPMIYASTYWFEYMLNLNELKNYDLWLANYTLPRLSTSFVIWQFTSTGRISGVSGNVDINIGYKNY